MAGAEEQNQEGLGQGQKLISIPGTPVSSQREGLRWEAIGRMGTMEGGKGVPISGRHTGTGAIRNMGPGAARLPGLFMEARNLDFRNLTFKVGNQVKFFTLCSAKQNMSAGRAAQAPVGQLWRPCWRRRETASCD